MAGRNRTPITIDFEVLGDEKLLKLAKNAVQADKALEEINNKKVSPEVKVEFDKNLNKTILSQLGEIDTYYKKNFKGVNLTEKLMKASGTAMDASLPGEERINSLKELILFMNSLKNLQKDLKGIDLGLFSEAKLDTLVNQQKALDEARVQYNKSLERGNKDAQKIAKQNQVSTRTALDELYKQKVTDKNLDVEKISNQMAKNFDIELKDDDQASKNMLTNYAKSAELFKQLRTEHSEVSKLDMNIAENAERHLIVTKQVYDVYKQLASIEDSIANKFDPDKENGLRDRLLTVQDPLLGRENENVYRNKLMDPSSGAYTTYAKAKSINKNIAVQRATAKLNDTVERNVLKREEKIQGSIESTKEQARKSKESAENTKQMLQNAKDLSGIKVEWIDKFNVSLPEAIAKVKELDKALDDADDSAWDNIEQDLSTYFQVAKMQADREGKDLVKLFGDPENYDKETLGEWDKNFTEYGVVDNAHKKVLNVIAKSYEDASKSIGETQKTLLNGEKELSEEAVGTTEKTPGEKNVGASAPIDDKDIDELNRYNLSLEECIEKIKELDDAIRMGSMTGLKKDVLDQMGQDQRIYLEKRAKELAKQQDIDLEELFGEGDKEYGKEFMDIVEDDNPLTEHSKKILKDLNKQQPSGQESAGQTDSQDDALKEALERASNAEKEAQKAQEEAEQAKESARLANEAAEQAYIDAQAYGEAYDQANRDAQRFKEEAERAAVEAEKYRKATDGNNDSEIGSHEISGENTENLHDKTINIKVEGYEQAKNQINSIDELIDKIPDSKTIDIKINDYSDMPYLTDNSGNMVKAYRGVHDTYGALGSGGDATFFSSDKRIGRSYVDAGGEKGKLYEANLLAKNLLEIEANGKEYSHVSKWLDGVDIQEVEKTHEEFSEARKNFLNVSGQLKSGKDKVRFNNRTYDKKEAENLANILKTKLVESESKYSDAIHRTDGSGGLMTMGTDAWTHYAKLMGFDTVRFKHIKDSSSEDEVDNIISDVYAVLSDQQIKNAKVIEGIDYSKPEAKEIQKELDSFNERMGKAIGSGLDYIDDPKLGKISLDQADEERKRLKDLVREAATTRFSDDDVITDNLIPEEAGNVAELSNAIDTVTEAVNRKTEAFRTEGNAVKSIVDEEKAALEGLATSVEKVASQADNISNLDKALKSVDKSKSDKNQSDNHISKKDDSKTTKAKIPNEKRIIKDAEKARKNIYEGFTGDLQDELSKAFSGVEIEKFGKFDFAKVGADGSASLTFIRDLGEESQKTVVKVKDVAEALHSLSSGNFTDYATNYDRAKPTKNSSLLDSEDKKDIKNYGAGFLSQMQGKTLSTIQSDALSGVADDYREIISLGEKATQTQQEFARAVEKTATSSKDNFVKSQYDDLKRLESKENMLPEFRQKTEEIKSVINEINAMEINPSEVQENEDLEKLITQLNKLKAELNGSMSEYTVASESSISKLKQRMATISETNTKASKGAFKDEFDSLNKRVSAASFGSTSDADVKKMNSDISNLVANFRNAEKSGASFFDTWKQRMGSLGAYLLSFASFYDVINVIKQTANAVREFDTALTEMRKVSDESINSLKNFQNESFNIADRIGSNALQIQQSTADFMRLNS